MILFVLFSLSGDRSFLSLQKLLFHLLSLLEEEGRERGRRQDPNPKEVPVCGRLRPELGLEKNGIGIEK